MVSPEAGSGPRYSIPFFQGVSYDATFESMDVPERVKKLRQEIDSRNGIRHDDIEFTFQKGRWNHLGEATLMNRIRSHPDVGERWVCFYFFLFLILLNLFHNRFLCVVDNCLMKKYPTLLEQIRREQSQKA